RSEPRLRRLIVPSSVASNGAVIISGIPAATIGSTFAGVATVTSPAPTRRTARPPSTAAPDLPTEPATISAWPKLPLLASALRTMGTCPLPAPPRVHILDDRCQQPFDWPFDSSAEKRVNGEICFVEDLACLRPLCCRAHHMKFPAAILPTTHVRGCIPAKLGWFSKKKDARRSIPLT